MIGAPGEDNEDAHRNIEETVSKYQPNLGNDIKFKVQRR